VTAERQFDFQTSPIPNPPEIHTKVRELAYHI